MGSPRLEGRRVLCLPFCSGLFRVRVMVEGSIANHHIKKIVLIGQLFRVSHLKPRRLPQFLSRLFNHFFRNIQAVIFCQDAFIQGFSILPLPQPKSRSRCPLVSGYAGKNFPVHTLDKFSVMACVVILRCFVEIICCYFFARIFHSLAPSFQILFFAVNWCVFTFRSSGAELSV